MRNANSSRFQLAGMSFFIDVYKRQADNLVGSEARLSAGDKKIVEAFVGGVPIGEVDGDPMVARRSFGDERSGFPDRGIGEVIHVKLSLIHISHSPFQMAIWLVGIFGGLGLHRNGQLRGGP